MGPSSPWGLQDRRAEVQNRGAFKIMGPSSPWSLQVRGVFNSPLHAVVVLYAVVVRVVLLQIVVR